MVANTVLDRKISTVPKEVNIQTKLEKELKRLLEKLGLNEPLQVCWQPDITKDVSGEVKQKIIMIYELNEEKAFSTLKHELIDYYLTSRTITPLVGLINLLIKFIEANTYKKKEKLVNTLTELID